MNLLKEAYMAFREIEETGIDMRSWKNADPVRPACSCYANLHRFVIRHDKLSDEVQSFRNVLREEDGC